MLLTETATTTTSISSVLEMLGTVVTWLFSQIASVVSIVMSNPLLLIPIGVVMTYTIISVFKRLF